MNFTTYLGLCKATDGEQITHTRIGNKEKRIMMGKYNISNENWNDFMERYYQNVFVNGNMEYLTEKQLVENGPVMIDIDLRYEVNIKKRIHTANHILDAVMVYAENIDELVEIENGKSFEVFVMEKSDVNIQEEITKDGIHMIIGIKMHKAAQVILRKKVMKHLKRIWDDLPIVNTWDDVLDEGVTKGQVNWQLYGSRKPDNQAYLMKYYYVLNKTDRNWEIEEKPLESFCTKTNFNKLSARYTDYEGYEIKEEYKKEFEENMKSLNKKQSKEVNVFQPITPPDSGYNTPTPVLDDDELQYYLNHAKNIKHTYAEKHTDWFKIGNAFKSKFGEEIWFDIFKEWSLLSTRTDSDHKNPNYDDWLVFFKKEPKCGGPTILEYSKKSNLKEFNRIEKEFNLPKKLQEKQVKEEGLKLLMQTVNEVDPSNNSKIVISTDKEACEGIHKKFGKRLIRGGDEWYVNLEGCNYWARGKNYVKQLIMDANVHISTSDGSKPYSAMKKGLDNIYSVLENSMKLFPVNEDFINEINRKTLGRVYYQDKYWDLNKHRFFNINEDKDEIIPLVYIKRPAPDFSHITKEDIKDFKEKVLTMFSSEEDTNLCLKAFARAIGGYYSDKLFYVLKGGRNSGKGLNQDLVGNSFGEYCSTIDIPMSKTHNSQDASELRWVLTAKCHLNRIAFTNETKDIAGKENLTLDGGIIKKVIASGGDKIMVRGHYKDELTVINNCTTFMCLNSIPESKPADALETMRLFNMPYQFVEAEKVDEDISYKLRVNDLKHQIHSNTKWRDIFTYLVFFAFEPDRIELSHMSKDNQEKYNGIITNQKSNSPVILLNTYFEKNPDGWVESIKIQELLKPAGLNHIEYGKFMKERGFNPVRKDIECIGMDGKPITENKKIKKIKKSGYSGLSLKKLQEDKDEIVYEDVDENEGEESN